MSNVKNKNTEVISEICPNCIETLEYQKKKIGMASNWLVCNTCGYRENQQHPTSKEAAVANFVGRIRYNNANNRREVKE